MFSICSRCDRGIEHLTNRGGYLNLADVETGYSAGAPAKKPSPEADALEGAFFGLVEGQ